jgi:hypothetical protein
MEESFSVNEILSAVDEIQNKKKEKTIKTKKINFNKENNTAIPIGTLKLIEEAEKIKN